MCFCDYSIGAKRGGRGWVCVHQLAAGLLDPRYRDAVIAACPPSMNPHNNLTSRGNSSSSMIIKKNASLTKPKGVTSSKGSGGGASISISSQSQGVLIQNMVSTVTNSSNSTIGDAFDRLITPSIQTDVVEEGSSDAHPSKKAKFGMPFP